MVKKRGHPLFLENGTYDLPLWLSIVNEKRSPSEAELITKACALAEKKGSEFYQSLVMADILHQLGSDANCLAAGLVYRSFQQAKILENDILETLEPEVWRLVEGLHKMDALPMDRQLRQNENLRRLLLAVVEDVRVVLIKLSEFTADMRGATTQSEPVKHQFALEAQEIYVPLANRLGVGQIKWELEDLAFRFMEPLTYKHIAKFLDERREDRERFIGQAVQQIEKALNEQGIKASVKGRVKHIYSIWKKMQRKGVGYHEIYDIHALRIIVSSISECYTTLGVIHAIWHHIPKEFDDYIANPKNNGYRSLHTAVFGPNGKTLEIQIRTREMHEQSELGIAAHWQYKEGGPQDIRYASKLANLRQVLKWEEDWVVDTASMDALRTEIFQDRVYVLTPKGEVMDLAMGSTVLDFAYHVHTEVGNRCRGAKINGRMVSLTTPLKSGDQIEIITAKIGGPSRDWLSPQLGYLKTLRARTKVHHWFKRQDRDKNIHEGRDVLERELQRLGVDNLNYESLANKLKFNKVEDMFAAIGAGDIRMAQILSVVQGLLPLPFKLAPKKIPIRSHHSKNSRSAEIIVAGIGNIYCQIARCCKPVPGEEIIGYLGAGRGVSVHRKDCVNVLLSKERQLSRLIQVEWQGEIGNQYLVDIVVSAFDRPGLLRDVSAVVASEHINVVDIRNTLDKDRNILAIRLSLEVSGIERLSTLFKRLQSLPNIISIQRVQQS